jgi:hypothetical protein
MKLQLSIFIAAAIAVLPFENCHATDYGFTTQVQISTDLVNWDTVLDRVQYYCEVVNGIPELVYLDNNEQFTQWLSDNHALTYTNVVTLESPANQMFFKMVDVDNTEYAITPMFGLTCVVLVIICVGGTVVYVVYKSADSCAKKDRCPTCGRIIQKGRPCPYCS